MAEDDKELKDQRVVTMMSPSELEAIDDWMFKNRIRSRGEAIRRLCRSGLVADSEVERFLDEAVAALNAIAAKDREARLSFGKARNKVNEGWRREMEPIRAPLADAELAFWELSASAMEQQAEVLDAAIALAVTVIVHRREGDISEVLDRARALQQELKDRDRSDPEALGRILRGDNWDTAKGSQSKPEDE